MSRWAEIAIVVAVGLLAGLLTGAVLRVCGLGEPPLWLW